MKIIPNTKKKPKKGGVPKHVKYSRKGIPRFVFELPLKDREDLNELAKWYKTHLNEKMSVAQLVRKAVKQLIRAEAGKIEKVSKGVFHAKPRTH